MTTVTIVGRLAADAELRITPSNKQVVAFTVAETERRLNRETNEWEDFQTLWHDCEAWKHTAAISGLQKGTEVILTGVQRDASYTPNGSEKKVRRIKIDVKAIGEVLVDRRSDAPPPQQQAWSAPSQEPF